MSFEPQVQSPPPPKQAEPFIAPGKRMVIGGLIYLLIHVFLLGDIIILLSAAFDFPLTGITLNLIVMLIGAVYLLLLMRHYLVESFGRFCEYGLKNIRVFLIGYGARFVLAIPALWFIGLFMEEFTMSPNTDLVAGMAGQNLLATGFLAVVMAPIVEELLFRGAIFAPLRKKNRLLAYLVSTLLFALLHIINFLILDFTPMLFVLIPLYAAISLPLAWVYEKSGSIWTAIFLHSLMNLVAIVLLPFL